MYKGGTSFVDHALGLVDIENQLTYTADETAHAEQSFKGMAMEHGVHVSAYQMDNGVFCAREFIREL